MSDGPIVLPELKVEAPAPPPSAPPAASPHGVTPRGVPDAGDDELTITVDDKQIGGWQSVEVRRSLLSVPASFDIAVTERYPDKPDVVLSAGDACVVKIGKDVVLTGYVDRYTTNISAQAHQVRITGRSKSEDLVDCDAIMEIGKVGGQLIGGTAISIAQKLAKPYDVTVESTSTRTPREIQQFVVNLGETVWEIIDRVTRYSALVAYDMPDGTLRLADVGTEKMASGFTLGQNIEAAEVMLSMDGRYREYEGHMLSVLTYGNDAGPNSPGVGQIVTDGLVPRFRKKYVISEQMDLGRSLVFDRTVWECNRRFGTSQMFSVTTDSWRDAAGTLWEPNHKAPIEAEVLKLKTTDWLIAEVTYSRGPDGQRARLVMMPPEAFSPEPTALNNYIPTVEGVENQNPTKPETGGAGP